MKQRRIIAHQSLTSPHPKWSGRRHRTPSLGLADTGVATEATNRAVVVLVVVGPVVGRSFFGGKGETGSPGFT